MPWNPLLVQFAVFAAVSGTLFLLFRLLKAQDPQLQSRLEGLNDKGQSILNLGRGSVRPSTSFHDLVKRMLQRLGGRLLPDSDKQRADIQLRLVHAGIYSPSGPLILAAVKVILMLAPPGLGLLAGSLGLVRIGQGLLFGALAGVMGMVLPSLWLDRRKRHRQKTLRQSLPDFLDLIVVCLESGLSFESALQRVADELRPAHPVLAAELAVVQREVALGRTLEDALQNFAFRSDLDIVKNLATFVQQARRFGSSMAETLRIHSDMLRDQREQRAEELAQKAAVKILFPTLLFIFPAIFVVLIGPAAIDIKQKFVQPGGSSRVSAPVPTGTVQRPSEPVQAAKKF